MALGRCAARLANSDGRIAILHDDKRLIAKLASFLANLQAQGRRSVTLSELFGPPRITVQLRGTTDAALTPLYVPF